MKDVTLGDMPELLAWTQEQMRRERRRTIGIWALGFSGPLLAFVTEMVRIFA